MKAQAVDLGLHPSRWWRIAVHLPLERGSVPAHFTEEVLASEDVSLLEPGGDDAAEASPDVLRHRCGRRLVEDQLKALARELPARKVGDDR
jgi:hypothetical protein